MSFLLPVRWNSPAVVVDECNIKAIQFDGVDQYVDSTYNADLEAVYGNYLNISVWIKVAGWPSGTSEDDVILSQYINTWLSLRAASYGDFEVEIWNAAESAFKRYQTSNQPLSLDTWHHIAVAFDGTATGNQVYIDGVASTGSWVSDFSGAGLDAGPLGGGKIYIGSGNRFNRARHYANVCVSEFWALGGEALDLSSNITKFRSTDGKGVELGSDGSNPTGTQATLYMKDPPTAGVSTDNAGSWDPFGPAFPEWRPLNDPTECTDAPDCA